MISLIKYYFTITLIAFLIIPLNSSAINDDNYKQIRLLSAYKKYIKTLNIEDNALYFIMKNEIKIPWSLKPSMTWEEKLDHPCLADVMSLPYPYHRDLSIEPGYNNDPGRFRNMDFLQAVYGNTETTVKNNLIKVRWMPKTLSSKPVYLLFNSHNGAAKALYKISQELDELPLELKKYVIEAFTYNWRFIAGTTRLSPHALGIAIDIGVKYSNYWRFDYKLTGAENEYSKLNIKYHNNIPEEIVNIFEKHDFIWGGRWYHYDTMHFEYRPEFGLLGRKPPKFPHVEYFFSY